MASVTRGRGKSSKFSKSLGNWKVWNVSRNLLESGEESALPQSTELAACVNTREGEPVQRDEACPQKLK